MALTDAGIVNMALLRAGERQTIDALTEDHEPARVASKLYAPLLDAMLQEFPWSFATRRAALALTTEERDGWDYVYALPTDLLAPRGLVDPVAKRVATAEAVPFELELRDNGNASVLLTDMEDAVLSYTARVGAARLSPAFAQALAWSLAPELALALAGKVANAQVLEVQARVWLARAKAADANERQDDVPPEAEAIRARD